MFFFFFFWTHSSIRSPAPLRLDRPKKNSLPFGFSLIFIIYGIIILFRHGCYVQYSTYEFEAVKKMRLGASHGGVMYVVDRSTLFFFIFIF